MRGTQMERSGVLVLAQYATSEKPQRRKMAHLLPKNLRNQNVARILGLDHDANLLFHKRFVLFLDTTIEKYYDKGQLTIIPTGMAKESVELQVVLIDQGITRDSFGQDLNGKGNKTKFADIHGRKLKFKNTNRPSLKILYLHALISFYAAEEAGWETQKNLKEQLFTGTAWGTPSGIGLETVLGKLA